MAVAVVDNEDSGYSNFGIGWTFFDSGGYQGSLEFAFGGDGSNSAQFHFTGLTAGEVIVSWTWTEHASRATNAPWEILDSDGTTNLAGGSRDQQAAPASFAYDGANWETEATVTITGTELYFRINNLANGVVIADAVQVEHADDSGGGDSVFGVFESPVIMGAY